MQSDVELAIPGYGPKEREALTAHLPESYFVEDRSSTNYGLSIVRTNTKAAVELTGALESFLSPLLPLQEQLKGNQCIVRVAVFNSLATATLRVSPEALKKVEGFGAELEISVYPVNSGEDDKD
jgi:hypothetical protein